MGVRTRVESIDRDVELIIAEELSPEAQARQFAAAAIDLRDQALTQNQAVLGRPPAFETFVNGRAGAAESTATVPGTIAYEFDVGAGMLAEIMDLLVKSSPVREGRYSKAFALFLDGVAHYPDDVLPAFEEALIVNTVAYARKIEGSPGRPPLSPKAPNGVFQAVVPLANRRYGNVASIKFAYESVLGGGTHLEAWASATRQTRKRFKPGSTRHERARNDWNRRNPAIRIRLR